MPTRVLVVEDDTLTRRNISSYLRRSQFEVEEAANGEEAVALIRSIDEYDVVVSDLRMPGMTNGMDVITLNQRVSPGSASILITGFGSDQIQKQAQAMGVIFIEKPLSLPDLLGKIRDLTEKS